MGSWIFYVDSAQDALLRLGNVTISFFVNYLPNPNCPILATRCIRFACWGKPYAMYGAVVALVAG